MSVKIYAMSRQEIEKLDINRPTIVVSIRSPGCRKAEIKESESLLDTLFLQFNDMDADGHVWHVYGDETSDELKQFSNDDAHKILDFIDTHKANAEVIVCQCEGGISRSSGLAAALSYIFDEDDSEFWNTKGRYRPNTIVFRTLMEAAGFSLFDSKKDTQI